MAFHDRRAAGSRISAQVRLVDLAPTLLESAGIPVPPNLDGRSLLRWITNGDSLPPSTATSVASRSNAGVALYSPDRLKLIAEQSAWSTGESRLEAFDLTTDPGEQQPLDPGQPRVAELTQHLARMVRSQSPGLVLTAVANPSTPLELDLRGPMIRGNSIKTIPGEDPDLRWHKLGEARLVVPAGTTAELRFEHLAAPNLKVRLTSRKGQDRPPPTHNIAVDGVRDQGPVFLALRDGGLHRADPPSPGEQPPGVLISWRGTRFRGTASTGVDTDLVARLRALGYLE
jgi:hypothetical protein